MHATSLAESAEAKPSLPLFQSFPGREQQIKTLTTLIDVSDGGRPS